MHASICVLLIIPIVVYISTSVPPSHARIARRAPKPMDENDPMAQATKAANDRRKQNLEDKRIKQAEEEHKKEQERKKNLEEKGHAHDLSAPPKKHQS